MHADLDVHRGARRGVAQRVGQEVGCDLAQLRLVADHDGDLVEPLALSAHRQVDGSCRVDRSGIDDGVGGEAQQVDRLAAQRSVLVQSGEQEHVVDEQAHALRLGLDPSHDPCYVLRFADSAERYMAACPRIVVSGVRSSWLASATKRRSRPQSLHGPRTPARSGRACCSAKPTSRPTSVPALPGGTRRVRSPAAMSSAVSSISLRGLSPIVTTNHAPTATRIRVAAPASAAMFRILSKVSCASASDTATTTYPSPLFSGVT